MEDASRQLAPGSVRERVVLVATGLRDLEKAAPAEIKGAVTEMADVWNDLRAVAEKSNYGSDQDFYNDPAVRAIFESDRMTKAAEALEGYTDAVCRSSATPPPVTGSPGSAPPPTTAFGSPGSSRTIPVPPGQPDWQSGIELGRTNLATGEVLRIIETADGRNVCFVRTTANSTGSGCSGVPPKGAQIATAQVGSTGSAQSGWQYIVFLPSGFSASFTLRDDTGKVIDYVRATDGRFIVTLVPDTRASANAGPPARSFDLVDAAGRTLLSVGIDGPWSRVTLLEVQMPVGGRVSVLEDRSKRQVCVEGGAPMAPSTAPGTVPVAQAFTACFGYDAAGVPAPQVMPASSPGAFSVYYVMLLPQGFASPLTVRDGTGRSFPSARTSDGGALVIIDPEAGPNAVDRTFDLVGADGRTLATVEAKRESPTQAALRACLRAQGLAIPEPDPNIPARQFAPAEAEAAWKACRGVYAATIPPSEVDRALVTPDCMAAQGWLIVVMGSRPADGAAYSAAQERCRPAPPTSSAGQPAGR